MNILFTCVGRRVELIQQFKKASSDKCPVIIYGTDSSDTAPALFFCDYRFRSPLICEKSYIPFLVDVCKKNKIDLLIPTIDTDLLLLSETKDQFNSVGTKVLISSESLIKKCRDKRLTGKLFESANLLSPPCYDNALYYDLGFPAFIKPLDGSSSIDAYKISNEIELQNFASRLSDYIIQPFVCGEEYTVDVFCDFDGNPVFITPRKRIAVRSGEVLKTEICQDELIICEIKRLINVIKPIGPITVQLIREKGTSKDWYIEINPRFGGGSPLSMKAGANSAAAVIDIMNDNANTYDVSAAVNHSFFSRFDQSIQINL